MYKHWWYTCDSGIAIRCDKCDAYAHVMMDADGYFEAEHTDDCPIPDSNE